MKRLQLVKDFLAKKTDKIRQGVCCIDIDKKNMVVFLDIWLGKEMSDQSRLTKSPQKKSSDTYFPTTKGLTNFK